MYHVRYASVMIWSQTILERVCLILKYKLILTNQKYLGYNNLWSLYPRGVYHKFYSTKFLWVYQWYVKTSSQCGYEGMLRVLSVMMKNSTLSNLL